MDSSTSAGMMGGMMDPCMLMRMGTELSVAQKMGMDPNMLQQVGMDPHMMNGMTGSMMHPS
eukprot:10729747-Alexandrium_andersonii.AAC.1